MIKLNDYLYSGDTVLRIIQKYSMDLKESAKNRVAIPVGECLYFDDAYERGCALQQIDFSKVDVNSNINILFLRSENRIIFHRLYILYCYF